MIEALERELVPPEKPRFWWGEDLVSAGYEQTVFGSSETTEIAVFPQGDSFPTDGKILGTSIATKSRIAQWGGEVVQSGVVKIAQASEESQTLQYQKEARVLMKSHTGNNLIIPPNTPLFGLYSQGPAIVGEELYEMVGSGKDIDIEGKRGRAWDFVYENPYKKKVEEIIGIANEIDNTNRWYIPRGIDLNLKDLTNAGRDYRKVVNRPYVDVKRGEATDIWFGELRGLKLSRRVAIEIAKPIVPKLAVAADVKKMEEQRIYPNGRHIGARLLHPGSGLNNPEGWPIRVEIDTRGSVQKPGAVIFRVMRAETI